jgi:uncharacterized protein (DUF2249 family)/tellurite resistance-related uncharacterized protein/hemerythrin-like domain-containing protein
MDAFESRAINPRKPALELPQGYVPFTRTPVFDLLEFPDGLRNYHSTPDGVWGEIVVESGALRYDWLDGSGESWDLARGDVGVIPAELPHRIEPLSEETRFYLQLYRARSGSDDGLGDADGDGMLDLRSLSPPLRHQQVLSAFDALNPGESLVFIKDRDPRPLLGRFAALRSHRYLWLPQAASETRWVVWLARRDDDFAPTIGEVLQADHGRLDALLDEAIRRVAAGEPAGAALSDFCWGVRRHLRIEEQRLFPLFLEVGGPELPTQVMVSEHRDIERQLQQIENDPTVDEAMLKLLRHTIDHHSFKEEGVLYPMLDVSLGGRRGELVETVFREIGWEALNKLSSTRPLSGW